jgi:hypothetical protein
MRESFKRAMCGACQARLSWTAEQLPPKVYLWPLHRILTPKRKVKDVMRAYSTASESILEKKSNDSPSVGGFKQSDGDCPEETLDNGFQKATQRSQTQSWQQFETASKAISKGASEAGSNSILEYMANDTSGDGLPDAMLEQFDKQRHDLASSGWGNEEEFIEAVPYEAQQEEPESVTRESPIRKAFRRLDAPEQIAYGPSKKASFEGLRRRAIHRVHRLSPALIDRDGWKTSNPHVLVYGPGSLTKSTPFCVKTQRQSPGCYPVCLPGKYFHCPWCRSPKSRETSSWKMRSCFVRDMRCTDFMRLEDFGCAKIGISRNFYRRLMNDCYVNLCHF